jgi:hypothetical protein
LHEITDLAGVRVIVFYTDDLPRVGEILRKEFAIDTANSSDRGAILKPNELGYHSYHYVLSISEQRSRLAEWKSLSGLKAEVQVRTVLQHAWAAISHALQYKASDALPNELSRKLFRLSGLLELADEEFSFINRRNIAQLASVQESLDRGSLDVPIDALSLKQYIEKYPIVKKLREASVRAGFKVEKDFGPGTPSFEEQCTELAWYCNRAGFNTIAEFNASCEGDFTEITASLKRLFARGSGNWSVTVPFVLELVIILTRPQQFDIQSLVKRGWGKSVAKRVIDAANSKTAV